MLRKLMLLAAGIALLAFSGCASNGAAPALTFAQAVTIVCSSANTEITTLQSSSVFTGGAQATLTNQIEPDVAKVCAQGATVTTANLQTIVNATIPALVTIVDNSSLKADDKTIAVLAIGGIATAVNTAIALAPAATAAPTAPASAPVAASGAIIAGL